MFRLNILLQYGILFTVFHTITLTAALRCQVQPPSLRSILAPNLAKASSPKRFFVVLFFIIKNTPFVECGHLTAGNTAEASRSPQFDLNRFKNIKLNSIYQYVYLKQQGYNEIDPSPSP